MHGIPFQERSKPLLIHSLGCNWQTKKITPEIMVSVGHLQFPTTFVALKSTDIDIILGMNWLRKYSAVLSCADKSVTMTHPSGEVMQYLVPWLHQHALTLHLSFSCSSLKRIIRLKFMRCL